MTYDITGQIYSWFNDDLKDGGINAVGVVGLS